MRVLPAMLLAILGLASPFGINAQTYPSKATYSVQNSDGLGPGPDNRAFGAAVHASDGKLFAAVNNTCGELFTTIPTSAGVTPTSSTLCLTESDDIDATQVTDRANQFAFANGVVVIGTPNRDLKKGGADVWRWDNANGIQGPSALGSGDGRVGHMGTAAATSGGDVIVLGAPKDDSSKGAAYVFVDYDKDNVWTRVPGRLMDPNGAAGDEFGGVVAVHNGIGTGNGWIVVASLKSDSSKGAVHAFARAGSPGAYQWFHNQTLTPSPSSGTAPLGYGAGLAITGRYLMISTRPSAVGGTDVDAWGEVYYMAGPNAANRVLSVDAATPS